MHNIFCTFYSNYKMNNYHIYDEVGRGKYSVVYKGRKKKSIEYVAVKSVERCRKKKLMDEVSIFQQIENDHISQQHGGSATPLWHPNILKFYNWYETRNHFWIILEYCSGGDLYSLLEQDKNLPEHNIKKFAYELLEGLSYLHSQGIIFGDLKPSNIMINEYCHLKLCDFSLAKKVSDLSNTSFKNSAEERTSPATHESSKNKAGTPFYMAPELFQDNGVYSYFSDFWSLGCILMEMASGRPPFYSNSLKELIGKITTEELKAIDGFSVEFNDLLNKMLQKDPIYRINWDEIKKHPWWSTSCTQYTTVTLQDKNMQKQVYQFTKRLYQPQLHFDKYLKTVRKIDPLVFHQMRNQQMVSNLTMQVAGLNMQEVDVTRLSYNVARNLQIQQEIDHNYQKQQASGVRSKSPISKAGQSKGLMVNTPQMNKPAQITGGDSALDFEGYNNNVKNRNSKLNKGKTYEKETELEDDYIEKMDIQIDFNNKAKEVQQVDKNDVNLGLNTKLVLDFTTDNPPEQSGQAKSVNTSASKRSPSPMNIRQQAANRQLKTNNFFAGAETSPKAAAIINAPPFKKAVPPKEETKVQEPKTLQQISKSPIIAPQKIDRMQLLNDLDDQEDYENEKPTQRVEIKNVEKFGYKHRPFDSDIASNCVRMMKDMTLFHSPLSQAQIKYEVQQLVSQTVQIGPVQNSGESPSSSATTLNISSPHIKSQGELHRVHTMVNIDNDPGISFVSQPTQMKVPVKSIEQLIIHNSDTAVKPIVGNKEIERLPDQTYKESLLQFIPWTQEEVLSNINTSKIESHLSDVYTSIASNTTINEKISTLQYFESIIINSNVSNSLINSVFMSLLKRMLEQIKSPMIKIRVCSVVGLLIRHSTMIDNDLAEIDIVSQLIETLRDSNNLVRRRAIAALGEYMFYAATQLDDEMADPVWELSDDAINIIVQSLDLAEPDKIVRFYACKTLENICAQSQSAGHRFATVPTVKQVLNIFLMEFDNHGEESMDECSSYSSWFEGIRVSAAIALSHICKLNPSLFPIIFETITSRKFCQILLETNNNQQRVQQAFITMLNLALHNYYNPEVSTVLFYYPEISSVLLREQLFLPALLKLLETPHIVIRGKTILTFLLLFKLDFRWITVVQQEIQFFNELDKLLRDNYKYVQCCLMCLADGIQDIIPNVLKTIAEQLVAELKLTNEPQEKIQDLSNLEFIRNNGQTEYGDFQDIITSQLYHVTILWDLNINPLIRSRLLSTPMIQCLASMLDLVDTKSFPGSASFLSALLIICENLSVNKRALMILQQAVLSLLVPVLYHKLDNSAQPETKCLSFKIYTDIMVNYIQEESGLKNGNQEVTESYDNQIDNLLKQMNKIMQSNDSFDHIPNLGLKLLGAIIEKQGMNPKMQKLFDNSGKDSLQERICSFYQLSHPRLNINTLKIMHALVANKVISLENLMKFKVLKNTTALMTSMLKNRQEQSLELMLDILKELLNHLNELVKTQEQQIVEHIHEIFLNFEQCIQLLSLTFDTSIVEKSSQCLILMLQLFAQSQLKKKEIYFIESHFVYLMSAIKSDKTIIQKRVLKFIYWALIQNEYQIQLTKDKIYALETQMELMINSKDRSIAGTSRDVYKLLTQQRNAATIKEEETKTYNPQQYSARPMR